MRLSPGLRPKFPAKCIKIGRIAYLIFTVIFVTSVTIICCVAQALLDTKEERLKFINFGLDQYTICLEIIDFFLLSTSISVLIYLMIKQ